MVLYVDIGSRLGCESIAGHMLGCINVQCHCVYGATCYTAATGERGSSMERSVSACGAPVQLYGSPLANFCPCHYSSGTACIRGCQYGLWGAACRRKSGILSDDSHRPCVASAPALAVQSSCAVQKCRQRLCTCSRMCIHAGLCSQPSQKHELGKLRVFLMRPESGHRLMATGMQSCIYTA